LVNIVVFYGLKYCSVC